MKFDFYKQMNTMDCDPTCLRMVANYYGQSITSAQLHAKTRLSRDGVSLLGLSDAAEDIGFRV